MTAANSTTTDTDWGTANHRCLLAEVARLRLVVQRHLHCQVPEQATAAAERDLARAIQRCGEAGNPPALDALTRLFGLSAFERGVVVLCLAPEIDASFELLYARMHDDPARRYPTPGLAVTLFDGDDGAGITARDAFMPEARLRRFRLVAMDPGRSSSLALSASPLCLTERVVEYLWGVNRIDARVRPWLHPLPPALLTPDLAELAARLHGWLEARRDTAGRVVINLVGPRQAGKRALARAVCERVGFELRGVSASWLRLSGSDRLEALRLLEREAVLSRLAIYLDAEIIARDADLRSAAHGLIDGTDTTVVVGSAEPWPADRGLLSVEMPRLTIPGQRALWAQALAGVAHTAGDDVDRLVQHFGLGPAAVSQVVAAARGRAVLREGDGAAVRADDLWRACRDQAGGRLDDLAQSITAVHAWDDLVVPDDVAEQLREIAAQVANRLRVYETWGFGPKLQRGRGISALFSGPSGTGKTLAAEVLAGHLDLSLYRIDLSGVVSKYIGETEKTLRRVFDAAEDSGAILFFDEADALFGKRSEVKDSHDRYANIEINYLLQRMEDYRGLAILATNMKSYLDQAFVRRLRFVVDFPFPDAGLRLRMWQRSFPSRAAVGGLDHAALARLDIAGGHIKNIAVNAAFLAAADGGVIQMEHVLKAARREYAKMDKLMPESEFGRPTRRAGR